MRIRLRLAYDGTSFHGFARQPGAIRTVQGQLEASLRTVLGVDVATVAAGRTDTGVHAAGQVVSFDLDDGAAPDLPAFVRSLNGLLGPEIVVADAAVVPADFDARFAALDRTYRYFVLNTPHPDPLLRHSTWHVPEHLDLDAMNTAARHLIGAHDFASFCRAATGRTTVRTVTAAAWSDPGDGLRRFEITANAFCHQMVRSIVGLLVDVGRGRRAAEAAREILAARNRAASPQIAPPHGLVLWAVTYPPDF